MTVKHGLWIRWRDDWLSYDWWITHQRHIFRAIGETCELARLLGGLERQYLAPVKIIYNNLSSGMILTLAPMKSCECKLCHADPCWRQQQTFGLATRICLCVYFARRIITKNDWTNFHQTCWRDGIIFTTFFNYVSWQINHLHYPTTSFFPFMFLPNELDSHVYDCSALGGGMRSIECHFNRSYGILFTAPWNKTAVCLCVCVCSDI